MKSLEFSYGSKDVQDFISLYLDDRLNLEPGFQRQSVWTEGDRKKLILSLIQNYPIPSVFLYKSTEGKHKYDVIDGKQRIESIFSFVGLPGFRNQWFAIKCSLNGEEQEIDLSWSKLKKRGYENRITGYLIQTVEVSGDLSDIIDLFVRINSTGKRLTGQEKRHAKFYHSRLMKMASRLGKRYLQFFLDNKIISRGQATRMKHVELICELLASIHAHQLLNKKTALDKIIAGESITERDLNRSTTEFVTIINLVKRIFPQLRATRFSFSAEFYSLFMLVWKFNNDRMILTDKRRNEQAQKLLSWMSNGVDELRSQINKNKGAKPQQQLFSNYLFTTRGDSDSSITRKRREDVLMQLFSGIFEHKDNKRLFSKEQRRLLWNSTNSQNCISCKQTLTWENFTIDHIKPHALGGPSQLSNAALMCRQCNSRKGKRLAA